MTLAAPASSMSFQSWTERQPCWIPSKASLRDQEVKRLDRWLSVVTSPFTRQYRQIARKNPRLLNLIGLRRVRFMQRHVKVRCETGVLKRNIGFGAKGGSLIGDCEG